MSVALVADQRVVAAAAEELIVAGAGDDLVVAVSPMEDVVESGQIEGFDRDERVAVRIAVQVDESAVRSMLTPAVASPYSA